MVHREFRSHVTLRNPTVAATEPESVPQRLSLVLANGLRVPSRTRPHHQQGGQFTLNGQPFDLGFRQHVMKMPGQRCSAASQGLQGTVLGVEFLSLLPQTLRGRGKVGRFGGLKFLNQGREFVTLGVCDRARAFPLT